MGADSAEGSEWNEDEDKKRENNHKTEKQAENGNPENESLAKDSILLLLNFRMFLQIQENVFRQHHPAD